MRGCSFKYKEIPFAHKDAIGCTVDYAAGRNRYMGYLISLGLYSFKGMKESMKEHQLMQSITIKVTLLISYKFIA